MVENIRFEKVFCIGCGEVYDLTDPYFTEAPLENCGECGVDVFVNQSNNPSKGFISYEHYWGTKEIVPERLQGALQKMISEEFTL